VKDYVLFHVFFFFGFFFFWVFSVLLENSNEKINIFSNKKLAIQE